MDLHTCNFSSLEVEEEGAQQVQSQSHLHSEFQDSQDCVEKERQRDRKGVKEGRREGERKGKEKAEAKGEDK